jgi:hypothetical protein
VLAADLDLLEQNPSAALFAYWAGRPDKTALRDTDQLARWDRRGDARERAAAAAGGEYYARTALQELTEALSDRAVEAEHARAWALDLREQLTPMANAVETLRAECDDLRRQLDDLRSSRSWRITRPLRWMTDRARNRRRR